MATAAAFRKQGVESGMGRRLRIMSTLAVAGLLATLVVGSQATSASADPPPEPSPITMQQASKAFVPAASSSKWYFYGLDTGDFNGDGLQDTAVTSLEGRAAVQVRLGNGDGTFGAPTLDATLPDPPDSLGLGSIYYWSSVAVGHFIGGPALDVVAGHNAEVSGVLHVFEGNGDGTFKADAPVSISSAPLFIRVADANNDGVDDMAIRGGDILTYLRSTANGVWNDTSLSTPGSYIEDLQFGELDGVNGPDIVVARGEGAPRVYRNDGTGVIDTASPINTNAPAARLIGVADFDGDAKNDVLGIDVFGNAQLAKGDGVGGFTTVGQSIRLSQSGYANSAPARPQDLNGDGRPDLVVPAGQSTRVVHVGTDGTISFDTFTAGSRDDTTNGNNHPVTATVPVEVTGDGRPDLVSATRGDWRDGEVTVMAGDTRFPPGRFKAPQEYGYFGDKVETYGDARRHALADLDSDEKLDLLSFGTGNQLKFRKGNGDRTFATYQDAGSLANDCNQGAYITTADFDLDGNEDVMCMNGSAYVGFGDGAGHVGSPTVLPLSTIALPQGVGRSWAKADFDADGRQDLVFLATNNCCPFGEPWRGHLIIQRYDTTNPRTFVTDGVGVDLGILSGPEPVAAGDFDEDGKQDVVVRTGRLADGSGGERFMFFKGNGDGSLQAPVNTAPGLPQFGNLETGDVNGDGHLDLVGSGANAGKVSVITGNGDGTFDPPTYYGGDANFDLTLADLNGDGQRDVIAGSWNHGVAVWAARADGTLVEPAGYLQTNWLRSDGVLAGDLDGDDRPDIIGVAYVDPHLTVLENTSTFGPPATKPNLKPISATAPTNIEAGQKGDITYTVRNEGKAITGGAWVDRVYLSKDGTWDPSDPLFFSVARSGDLGQGAEYTQTVNAPFVPETEGASKVIVRTDLFNTIDETQEGNNLLVMPGSVNVDVPVLTPGAAQNLTIADGQLLYRRIVAPMPDQVLDAALAVDGSATLSVRNAKLPTTTARDFESPVLSDPQIVTPSGNQTRYVLLQGNNSAATGSGATLELHNLGFEILSISPDAGSNQGQATTVVKGGGFVAGSTASITNGTDTRNATAVTVRGATELEATFDLTGLPTGAYDLTITRPDATSTTKAGGYTVNNDPAGDLKVLLSTPGRMRTNWVATASVTVTNTGGTDQGIPVVFLDSAGGARFKPAGLAAFVDDPITIVPRVAGGPQTRIPPHAAIEVKVPFVPSAATLAAVQSGGSVPVHFDARLQRSSSADPLDFAARLAPYRPLVLSDASWDAVVAYIGGSPAPDSWGEYVQLLASAEAEARSLGLNLANEAQLLKFLVDKGLVFAPGAKVLGKVRLSDGSGAVGGTVRLTGGPEAYVSPVWPDGSYAVRDVVPGDYRAEVGGYLQEFLPSVHVNGATITQDVPVERGEIIKGFVTRASDGAPVADALVTITDPLNGKVTDVRSGADGFYQSGGNRVGDVSVEVNKDGFTPFGPEPATVTAGSDATLHATLTVGGSITGVVHLPGGAPAPGADVVAIGDPPTNHLARAVSGADGSYSLPLLQPGTYDVTASKSGAGRITIGAVVVTDGATTPDVDLQLTAPASLTGVVRDGDGAPVAGATVWAPVPGSNSPTATTGADGSYSLSDVPAGEVRVMASATGFGTELADLTMTAGASQTKDFVLTRLGKVTGLVHNADGAPLAGVKIDVVSAEGVPLGATTAIDGTFAVEPLLLGKYTVSAYRGAAAQAVDLTPAAPTASVDLSLTLGAVTGRVVDGAGAPSPGVGVMLRSMLAGGTPVTSETDTDGRYRFPIAIAGDFEVIAFSWENGLSTSGTVSANLAGDTNVADLGPAGSALDVFVDGPGPGTDPVVGANVHVMRADLAADPNMPLTLGHLTDATGHAVFPHLTPGTYTVEITGPGIATTSEDVTVSGPSTSSTVVTDVAKFLTRRVTDGSATPIAGAFVNLRERTSGRLFAARTATDGTWVVQGAVDGGVYDGWVSAPGKQALALTGLAPQDAAAPIAGTDVMSPVDTLLNGTISRDGRPQGGAQLDLIDAAGMTILTTYTLENGKYALVGIPSGVPVNIRITYGGRTALAFATNETFTPGSHGFAPEGGSPKTDPPGDVDGPEGVIPAANPFDSMNAAELAKAWLWKVWKGAERLPEDLDGGPGSLEARLGPFDPNWCAEMQAAWIAASQASDRKDERFQDVIDNQTRLFDEAVVALTVPALEAIQAAAQLYLALQPAAQLGKLLNLQKLGLSPEALVKATPIVEAMLKQSADLAQYIGLIRTAIINGDVDKVGYSLNLISTVLGNIGENAEALIKSGAVGKALASSAAGVLGNLVTLAGNINSIVSDLTTAMGTAAGLLNQVNQTHDLYRQAFERFKEAYDYFVRVRAAGCKCPNGQPVPTTGNCNPPPPEPPKPPPPSGPSNPPTHTTSRTDFVNSRDPNSIDGPAGHGEPRYVTKETPLGYVLHFENAATASAPAQKVVVTHTLDADIDLDTFELGDIGYGATRLSVPPHLRNYETTQALPGGPYSVRIRAWLDVDTRVVTWEFMTIDPGTGDLPTDPDAGFLPPNVTSPQGEGVMEYRAKVKADTAVGATVPAQASIVFDDNPAIETNTWTNTIGVVLPPTSGGFHPLVPARILDTRSGVGGPAVKLGPGETRTVKVTDVGGVPAGFASAVALNVTAVGASSFSHLSVWPTGKPQPTVSNLNFKTGQTVPNLAVVQVGTDGNVQLFNNQGNVDVLFDVSGWFDFGGGSTVGMPAAVPEVGTGSPYVPLVPSRIMDTRSGIGGPQAKLGPGETRSVRVTDSGGVPAAGVKAVVLNVTAVGPSSFSHLSLWPSGASMPTVSNLNFPTGQTVPNLAIVQVGTDGNINLFNNQGNVDVLFDVAGYFADPALAAVSAGAYHPLTPARIVDTRSGIGGPTAKLGPGETREMAVTSTGGVPASGVKAVVLNVTAVGPDKASHLSLWPSGQAQPTVSNLNFMSGQTVPNLAVVQVGDNGKVNLFNNQGNVDVIFDIAGYVSG